MNKKQGDMKMKKTYTKDKLEQISDKLRELPPSPRREKRFSTKEAINYLKQDIRRLRKLGYTIEEIAEILKAEDVKVAPTTLKTYLQSKRRRKPQKQKDTPPPAPAHIKAENETADEAVSKGGADKAEVKKSSIADLYAGLDENPFGR